jgi:hypothetical protein
MGLMDHLLLSLWKKKTGYVEPVAPKAGVRDSDSRRDTCAI